MRPGDEVVIFGRGGRRRADGPGLGRGDRHHLLRDRHPDRCPRAPHLRRRTSSEQPAPQDPDRARASASSPRGATAAAGVATDRLVRARSTARALGGTDSYDVVPDKELVVIADDGVPLHVEIDEPRGDDARAATSCPTVVFSHGYTLSLRSWVFQRRALTAAGYRVVVWDQRGHGRSGTGRKESATHRPARPRPGPRHRRGGARGAARAGRALDGRHDDDVARRATTTS